MNMEMAMDTDMDIDIIFPWTSLLMYHMSYEQWHVCEVQRDYDVHI